MSSRSSPNANTAKPPKCTLALASSQRVIIRLGRACFRSFTPASVTGVRARPNVESLVSPFR